MVYCRSSRLGRSSRFGQVGGVSPGLDFTDCFVFDLPLKGIFSGLAAQADLAEGERGGQIYIAIESQNTKGAATTHNRHYDPTEGYEGDVGL